MDPHRIMLFFLCFLHICICSITLGESSKNLSPSPVQPTESYTSSEDKTLEDESANQENILSQLLGDYDKVKAISEGSNCKCKCVVKPLNRDSCERSRNGYSQPDDFYTVETITSGPDCKCACIAPPSALNPCEGDFRLKKLRETEKNGFKLSTIIEMLEGAFYGLDLLKLHTVTTKIVGRVEKLEEVISKRIKTKQEEIKDSVDEKNKKAKRNITLDENLSNLGKILQRDVAAVFSSTHDKYEEQFLRDEQANFISPKPHPEPPQQVQRSPLSQRQIHLRPKPAPKPVIRGVTFYKAKDTESDLDDQLTEDESYSGDNTIDMLIEDQLIKHELQHVSNTEDLIPTKESFTSNYMEGHTQRSDLSTKDIFISSVAKLLDTVSTSTMQTVSLQQITTEQSTTVQTQSENTEADTTVITTQAKDSSIVIQIPPTISNSVHTSKATPMGSDAQTTSSKPWKTNKMIKASTDRNKGTEDDFQKVIGRCKDTLSTISGPTTQNTYGRNEGAWMKDPLAKDEKIYVTNYYYGNTLVEFRNLDNFKQGRWSNSYKLPYSWIGTGNVVYNGSFYYNRAFTRNIIKYDLKHRYVAAWSMLHNVVFEEATPWRWKGHSDIDFAVDENGLWIIYPAIDDEGFLQEVIVLSKLNAQDLTTQKETTFRTGLRKDFFGNCFVICGVLYAVDNYNKKTANISYAFDTHTNTQIVPRLLFENEYSYTTQIDYNPKDRLLYAWDNGHQVTYQVIFAY
ncbi:olfactomedin-like protein 2B [Bufo gargarizans]|uniref:olfactomedin-like protein 2B n=1 Tax=Bufo gargarizans TaxID=30331 RepID=UPI001CF190DA|nr:olfactomedin-like protein 2B [Bufo gargarizans]